MLKKSRTRKELEELEKYVNTGKKRQEDRIDDAYNLIWAIMKHFKLSVEEGPRIVKKSENP